MPGTAGPSENSVGTLGNAGARRGPLLVESLPEYLHTVQHLHAGPDEGRLLEPGRVVALVKLVPHVCLVLILDPVVPREECQRQVRNTGRLHSLEPGDELFPETGGGPVLDGKGGPHRLVVVVAAIQPEELVAEPQRGRRAVPPLAEVVES